MSSIPLLKALTSSGAGSRRVIASLIKQGRVTVKGSVIEDFLYPVSESDNVAVDGKNIPLKQESKIYLMLNKPKGIVSTTSDELGRHTVTDLLPGKYKNKRLYPVGRLDKNSTGLLLLTNDGELAYQLTHPKYEHEKEYLVSIKKELLVEEKQKLEQGIMLEDGITYPAKVRHIKEQPFNYSIVIHEGRNRQVRRMFAEIGHKIHALKRIRVGNLKMGSLPEGKIRELSETELMHLLQRPSPFK